MLAAVVAAGNDGVDACGASPARVERALTVGASGPDDQRAVFSNFGSCLDLFAPGVAVRSAGIGSDAAVLDLDGTSMAAPHVTGAAALYLQILPGANMLAVRGNVAEMATVGALAGAGAGSPNKLLFTPGVADRPIGNLDVVRRLPTGVQLFGWALDPDTTGPIDVHVYVDGGFAGALRADRDRPDIAAAYPRYGAAHGFDTMITPGVGSHEVCVYAINVELYPENPQLGCRTVNISDLPFGWVDSIGAVPTGTQVTGWAIDPDSTAPIDVHIYIDGQFSAVFTANEPRPDVGATNPGYGDAHGFGRIPVSVTLSRGVPHTICVYGINVGPGGTNSLIGCRTITVF
ncbi:MAG TPA: S8 family serine peptidase [Mycobacteriales bacterium]|nr:S8 family serine peptidase [Mycobacteriales bacterium]